MEHFIRKHANAKNIILLLILLLLFQQVLFKHLLPQGEHALMLDTQFFYSAEDAYDIIGNYSEAMRHAFMIGELTLDLVFPWIYTLLFAFLFAVLFKGAKIVLFPFLMLIFDYLENAAILFLLIRYPQEYSGMAAMAAVFSAIKWILLPMILLLLLAGIFRKILRYSLQRRSKH